MNESYSMQCFFSNDTWSHLVDECGVIGKGCKLLLLRGDWLLIFQSTNTMNRKQMITGISTNQVSMNISIY